ncbi:hypothetical protein [Planococcus sp. YIM B11945]|uniref:hypothetical protein n=1 Tax=Planococcus sp. YIM B11945 TaxID=3435410 RepID=UPI003D7DB47A
MNEDQLLATADIESVDSALDGYEEGAAVHVHQEMLKRMMEHFPDVFLKEGDLVLYREQYPIYTHDREDGDIDVKERL